MIKSKCSSHIHRFFYKWWTVVNKNSVRVLIILITLCYIYNKCLNPMYMHNSLGNGMQTEIKLEVNIKEWVWWVTPVCIDRWTMDDGWTLKNEWNNFGLKVKMEFSRKDATDHTEWISYRKRPYSIKPSD